VEKFHQVEELAADCLFTGLTLTLIIIQPQPSERQALLSWLTGVRLGGLVSFLADVHRVGSRTAPLIVRINAGCNGKIRRVSRR
jgi:hypothetical protein